MFQNGASVPKNIVCARSTVIQDTLRAHGFIEQYKCTPCELAAFKRRDPTTDQQERADADGRRYGCWSCTRVRNGGTFKNGRTFNRGQTWTPDHQPPQDIVWAQLGGCKGACSRNKAEKQACFDRFNAWADDPDCIRAQCAACSNSQGGDRATHDGSEAIAKLAAIL